MKSLALLNANKSESEEKSEIKEGEKAQDLSQIIEKPNEKEDA